ncbi:hypothetical protein G9A89_019755 [Geosiphon pyriformis]|nr:hypothetical protein G9A89_019755 [Geosiphon pyriformis]
MEMLENNRKTAAGNISHAQERQKERHDKHLSEQPMEFKIGDQVLLHCTKTKKQWSEKFDRKWDSPFHIHEVLGNGAYKLRLEDRILKKAMWEKKLPLAEGGEKEGGKEREKGYKRRYLVPELEEIKKALARGTKLPETREWTPDNAQEWKERLPPAYWFYKIGEQLDLKTLYEDFSQKMFNKEAIQQQHTDYTLPSNIAQTIGRITNQQFEDLQKAILKATIEHYTNEATITNTYGFAEAQF